MAMPVWVLSVDLQTKTATFQSGMADAAKSARGAFNDIKGGAGDMGRATGGSMMEARHGVMLLGEEFGIHLPRALTSFIASIGPVGAAMEAAFPFLAIAVGATLLIEALVKMHEAGEKVTEDQLKLATAVQNAFNALDQKILQAGIRADELRGDHLAALKKQLELINDQSMTELVKAFGEVAKAADIVFADLKSHWYTLGIGATGAKHAMEGFQAQYESLLAQGKDKDAGDLLAGTLDTAQKVLALQKEGAANSGSLLSAPKDGADVSKSYEAQIGLKKAGVGWTEKEIDAQEALVNALKAQVDVQSRVAELKKLESDNANRTTAGALSGQAAAAAKAAADSQTRLAEMVLAADKAASQARLAVTHAGLEERLQNDLEFADRERDIQLASNAVQIAALDKLGKDYPNQLKALKEKALEISQAHETAVTELESKAQINQAAENLANLEQSEREQIAATRQGSTARLAALDDAIKQEEEKGLQQTGFYKALLTERVQAARQAAEEQAQISEAGARLDADNELRMGELSLAAFRAHQNLMDSAHRATIQREMAEATQAANAEFALKQTALTKEAAALDKSGKDYENKLKAIQNKETQLVRAHENELTAIKEKAETERNQRILAGEAHLRDSIATGLTSVLMRQQSFVSMMGSLGDEVVAGMLKNAIMSMLTLDMTKEKEAAAAARKGYLWGIQYGGPIGPVLGPIMGAAAFAAVMAFDAGGVVPGVGHGDVVPALLSPGEGIVPGGVMDGLSKMARSGSMGGGASYHLTAHFAPHVSAVDATGVDRMLTEHAGKFQKHMETTIRKFNR